MKKKDDVKVKRNLKKEAIESGSMEQKQFAGRAIVKSDQRSQQEWKFTNQKSRK